MSGPWRPADPTAPWPGAADGRQQVHLLGFMGSGKSTVGARLARMLVWSFLDLDTLVERYAGARVADIFAGRGEEAFRTMEAHALRQAVLKPRTVVALGGGTFLAPENRRLIAERAISVWLDCALETAARRVESEEGERPLWGNRRAVEARYRQRRAAYALAEIRVDADGDPDTVARAILRRLQDV